MSAKDMIKKSILESDMYSQSISMSTLITICVNMLIALLIGYLIYCIYKRFFVGVVYSRYFAATLVGMTVLTCMVTLAISTNIVISLGMVGALSIVRYRTAIKEPLDIMYLFWAITEGITIGASLYILAAIGMLMMLIIVIVMSKKKESRQAYVMIIHFVGDGIKDEILKSLKDTIYSVKSCIMRDGLNEMSVQMDIQADDGITDRIRGISGVKDVSLIQYNGDYHG